MAVSTPGDGHSPVRILLVDDNPANLLALQAVLEPLRQELIRARSGAEALEILNRQDCALVLMDVHMPALDGFQTVEAIRRRNELRHLPVMFLTAMFRDDKSAARGYALGAVDFIMKPFVPEIIRAKVGAFVALYQHNEEIKRQELRIAEEVAARRAAEVANRTKEEFIAILGHDLRNPLYAITMTAEKHGRAPQALEPCREASQRIGRSAQRISRLINDVLDLTRSRLGGGIPIERKPIDMAQLCRVPIEELRAIHPECQIAFQVDGDVLGAWDPDRVIQVIANLVGNAVKQGAAGGVRVALRGDGDFVDLEVHNFGDPIPPSRMENLFEPFQRGEHRGEGLGLGLYIVSQIVSAHGGTITVESKEADGTTFTVRWPRAVLPKVIALA